MVGESLSSLMPAPADTDIFGSTRAGRSIFRGYEDLRGQTSSRSAASGAGSARDGHLAVYAQYVSQIHTMLAMVKAEMGIAMVPVAASALHFEVCCSGPSSTCQQIWWS
jgi:hypothetical protein